MTYLHQCEIASMKVSCTLHFSLPPQRAQYPPHHPWNGHRCSQVLVWRLGGAQALGCMASDDAFSDDASGDRSMRAVRLILHALGRFKISSLERPELYPPRTGSFGARGRREVDRDRYIWIAEWVHLLGGTWSGTSDRSLSRFSLQPPPLL